MDEYTKLAGRWPSISKYNISYLVREYENRYFVFLDKDLDVDWITSDEYDKQNAKSKAKRDQILSRIEFLQHQPIIRLINRKTKIDFNCMLAESWVYALENHYEMANDCIMKAEEYISKRNFELSRKWHLCFSLLFLVMFLLIFAFLKYNIFYVSELLRINTDSLNKTLYAIFGTVGATLSIIQKTGKRYYNCESGKLLHALEAFSRQIAGIISSLLIIYMVDLDLIFSSIKTGEKFNSSIILVSIVAGFSERLVPSIISKFETIEVKGVKVNEQKGAVDI